MDFDPAADPWGTAMLAAAGLWVVSAVLVLLKVGGSRRTGGRVMLVSLLGFLGSAAAGTWQRLQTGPAPTEPTPTDAEPAADEGTPDVDSPEGSSGAAGEPNGSTGGTDPPTSTAGTEGEADTDDVADTDDAASTGDAAADTDDATDTGDEIGTGEAASDPPPATGSKVPVVDPLPSDPEERDKEIRARLREASAVAGSNRRCAKLEDVALAWAMIRVIPEGTGRRKAESLADDLDECRRKLLYSASRRVRRTQVDARDAFAETLAERFEKEHGLRVAVNISGMSHEKLRVGGSGLDATKADEIMDGGLRKELEDLAFATVVLSNTKVPKTYEFEVTPEGQLGQPEMQAVGLGERLVMP